MCREPRCTEYAAPGRPRCPAHEHAYRALRYGSGWQQQSRAAIAAYVMAHGNVCPGWGVPPHAIAPSQWTTDHERGPMCRACNSRKASTEGRERWWHS
jgi:hypothetical protein